MARRVNQVSQGAAQASETAFEGGTPGIIPDAETRLGGPKVVGSVPEREFSADEKAAPEPVEYRVVGGARYAPMQNGKAVAVVVNLGQCVTTMQIGKLVSERTHDLDALRRQGVMLEEVQPKAAAQAGA